jgi:aspartate-semialdehyde dehydrogenase
MRKKVVSVVGATGAVGREILKILEERNFPISELKLFASWRSRNTYLKFKGEDIPVYVLDENRDKFYKADFVFFSAGKRISREYAKLAVSNGAVVIDNSAAFRLEKDIPLVVPEVNPERLTNHQGLIANPNCSTIQLVVAIKPLYDLSKIKRLVISSYQSVSGTGWQAVVELKDQIKYCLEKNYLGVGEIAKPEVYSHQIAFNLFPHIGEFLDNGYSEEEMKLINETRKILNDYSIKITATTVRVPVFIGHSLSVNIEFFDIKNKITKDKAREVLKDVKGVKLLDNPKEAIYPLPIEAAGKDLVYVGRIREDESVDNGLNLWIVADNLRKGAALNAVQIAEILISKE